MGNRNQDFLDQLSKVLTVVPQKYVDTLLTLSSKLDDKDVKWVVSGDLAERLRLVKVDPDYVEIVTTKIGAEKIFALVQDFITQPIRLQTQQIMRNALVGGEELPVFARSYYFEFKIKDVTVKVEGDLQFKVGRWNWGEVFDFDPEYVYVIGKKIAVTPLPILYDFYQMLGWMDRAEKISQILTPHAAK